MRFTGPEDDESDRDDPGEIEVEDLSVGTLTADGIRIRLKDGRTLLTFRR